MKSQRSKRLTLRDCLVILSLFAVILACSPPADLPQSTIPGQPSPTPAPVEFFKVSGVALALNGPSEPTLFTIKEAWLVSEIRTYHWNQGSGAKPGTIGLKRDTGDLYGPWQAAGQTGQGGVSNAYWVVHPNIILSPGTYTVIDSDPATWAQNYQTGGAGMAWGSGFRRANP